MAAGQRSEKKNPPPEKKAPLPKVVTLNKALKLAQAWVDKMSAPEPDELNDKDFEGRPSGLGLGAKVAPNAKRSAPTDPVERRLLGKVNAQKRKSAEEEKINTQEASDDDSGEPQGRTSACSKKRELPSVTSMPSGKKAKSQFVCTKPSECSYMA
ncbi:hypothetical protein D1007_55780 [Hordeum vulgare]|uniref:Uncharacterized protein n=1 Tax=Hordeum vulgare subsp. vulgare TaxID=112509 RepID=A0A8I6Z6Y4_HORVV|nr:uncharacterized protein LOC123411748 [Hordeum vulgare subsp. vulgare]KAE8772199.1 hypothetical protein D1007_55780 [Hordeum vulgare]